jgi:acetoin utilization deacetylase AcuC-like enzyme
VAGNPHILFISTFQHPLYPGSGVPSSAPNVINFPLDAYSGSDVIRRLWLEHIRVYLANYQPQLILVSAGFDGHAEDPLAQLSFMDDDYRFFGTQLKSIADECCQGRLIACLEGGYHLAALGRSVGEFLQPFVEVED